jgi:MtrB/PioB family decaheme-associated outer membrane protein
MRNADKLNWKVSAIALAVASMFITSAAFADDEEIKDLTQPKSSVQVEVINVDSASAKFGEYNGLNTQGPKANGALSIKGGGGYTNNEQGETTRWSVTGDNLGLTSRSAGASISDQGSWSFGVNYDQLQHNISDTYQTPYQGNMGGGTFTLPSNFGSINTTKNNGGATGTPAIKTGTQYMSTTQQNDFAGMNISSTRQNTTVSGKADIDKDSNFTFEYNNLTQTGAKLQSMPGAGMAKGNSIGETPTILPMPTNYQTDTFNVAYNWKSESAHFTTSYFGSFFQDGFNSVSFQPWGNSATATNNAANTASNGMQTMSTAPSNSFNQLNMAGGYDFTEKTKLTGNASVGRNTQNAGFSVDPYMMISPAAGGVPYSGSMNGLVNTTHLDAKITDRTVKDLVLSAGYKFDERDNLSQSNIYSFSGVGTPSTQASTSAQPALYPNTPLSLKQSQIFAGADYRLTRDQKISLTYGNNTINRWCNQYGTSGANTQNANQYPVGTNCVTATSSNENKLDALYKIKATEGLNFKAGVGYANRIASLDQNAIAAFSQANPNNTPAHTYLPGTNGQDYFGYVPYFEASRKQFIGKASATWDATEKLNFTLGGKYTNDTYPNSTYGVQNGNSWSLNLDSTYAYAEAGTIIAYATQQNMQRNLSNYYSNNASTAPTTLIQGGWTNNLTSNATTVGLGIKQGDLVNGKLTLSADATMSFASSWYSTNVNYNPVNTTSGGQACNNPAVQSCGILPAIQNNLGIIKLGGSYQIDKQSRVGLMYWYQHLYSNDYYYNGLQVGNTPANVLPTNQTAPSYSVNVISANYTYTFD